MKKIFFFAVLLAVAGTLSARDLILEDVEDYAKGLMRDSLNISKHAGRKTVMAEDVKLAKKLM